MSQIKRSPAMDIIRLIALFFVVSGHFFLHTEFYKLPVQGITMYAATTMRSATTTCIPLFLMLSGYLMKNKKPTKSYYFKLVYLLSIYLLASLCCWFYQAPGFPSLLDLIRNFPLFLDLVCNYCLAPYSWYVSMYIGLFLLIPYLNILYNGLETKKQKQGLIITMMFLTSIPCVTNIYRFNPSWWLNPASNSTYYQLLPIFWLNCYPVTHYFIGAYLKDHPLKLSTRQLALGTVCVYLANGLFNFYRCHGTTFIEGLWQHHGSVLTIAPAFMLFSLIASINFERISAKLASFLSYLSGLCFGAYLVSWIFDDLIYPQVNTFIDGRYRLDRYLWVVPLIYAASLALSAVLNQVYKWAQRLFKALPRRKSPQPQ